MAPLASKEKRDELFSELLDGATLKKPKVCDVCIEKIKNYTFSKEDEEILEDAIRHIRKYRFDKAVEILRRAK